MARPILSISYTVRQKGLSELTATVSGQHTVLVMQFDPSSKIKSKSASPIDFRLISTNSDIKYRINTTEGMSCQISNIS